ncbi:Cleavage stimulation factor subunit 2 [Orchesella cincta]|uniref:Cleavage stimulation factor subunit 2 n=1 Tax=Orchesella cincta TaxID=48709 RepID=A0A1D2MJJ9_ORCCI|nr:Cleavage stimulation factor subunit 2 [Orchesella cincta]
MQGLKDSEWPKWVEVAEEEGTEITWDIIITDHGMTNLVCERRSTHLQKKLPEMISRAVASLPPEQMFELMKQMKLCIQNNPAEARTMLLQNPQLSYALLQALVVMKIIDPPNAISMLHKDNQVAMGSLLPEGQMNNMMQGGFIQPQPATENPWIAAAVASTPLMPPNPPGPFGPAPVPPVSVPSVPVGGDLDLRQLDPRLRSQGGGNQDFDLRDPRGQGPSDRFSMDPRRDRDLRDRDMRGDRDLRDPRGERDRDLRDRDLRDSRIFGSGNSGPGSNMPTTTASSAPSPLDPRAARRGGGGGGSTSGSSTGADSRGADISAGMVAANKAAMNAFAGMPGLGPGATDKEKANLIMQVLQLSDEQINHLPAEQRQSILTLKEQIAKSTSQGR